MASIKVHEVEATTPVEMAYMAGVLDSDGWVTWHGRTIRFGLGQGTPQVPEFMQRKLGGSIQVREACTEECRLKHVHYRSGFYIWAVSGERAVIALQNLRPFLLIKGDRVDALIRRFQSSEFGRYGQRWHDVFRRAGWKVVA